MKGNSQVIPLSYRKYKDNIHSNTMEVEEMKEDEFRGLLSDVSKWYDEREGSINMLKVLYTDHVSRAELCKACKTRDLLELLVSSGDTDSTDMSLIYDTINATKQFGLEKELKKRIPSFPNVKEIKISKFKIHRQRLINLGKKLDKDDIEKISAHYITPVKKYTDSWSLIIDLEKQRIICADKMESFIKQLMEFELHLAVEALKEAKPFPAEKRKRNLCKRDLPTDDCKTPKIRTPSETEQREMKEKPSKNQESKVKKNVADSSNEGTLCSNEATKTQDAVTEPPTKKKDEKPSKRKVSDSSNEGTLCSNEATKTQDAVTEPPTKKKEERLCSNEATKTQDAATKSPTKKKKEKPSKKRESKVKKKVRDSSNKEKPSKKRESKVKKKVGDSSNKMFQKGGSPLYDTKQQRSMGCENEGLPEKLRKMDPSEMFMHFIQL
ncbi:gelsolin-related protein of 125 kDa-like isoform X2 [Anneissia japonica]|uniref:gelsolin-related protein of 125 kDa-like isoform X2 n=1 Tax=Anneissia japonica TaxID=1529436 RepID=UPI0014259975|nr:gelsolin-related protein of 125 kDa-like isoform X2 [Anneissia japonica]